MKSNTKYAGSPDVLFLVACPSLSEACRLPYYTAQAMRGTDRDGLTSVQVALTRWHNPAYLCFCGLPNRAQFTTVRPLMFEVARLNSFG